LDAATGALAKAFLAPLGAEDIRKYEARLLDYMAERARVDRYGRALILIDGLEIEAGASELILSASQIGDIEPLKTMTNPKCMYLDHNQIEDVSPLQHLQSLTELWLEENQIIDITPLESLTNLRHLSLTGNPLYNEEVRALEEALPNCEILFDFDPEEDES
jgi:hypothetical protein